MKDGFFLRNKFGERLCFEKPAELKSILSMGVDNVRVCQNCMGKAHKSNGVISKGLFVCKDCLDYNIGWWSN